jgi:hypothetical protein
LCRALQLQELHMKGNRDEFFARVAFPGPVGGNFSPQFLDAILHVENLHPDREPSAIYFAGG